MILCTFALPMESVMKLSLFSWGMYGAPWLDGLLFEFGPYQLHEVKASYI